MSKITKDNSRQLGLIDLLRDANRQLKDRTQAQNIVFDGLTSKLEKFI